MSARVSQRTSAGNTPRPSVNLSAESTPNSSESDVREQSFEEDDDEDIDISEMSEDSDLSDYAQSPFSDVSSNSFAVINRNTVMMKEERSPVKSVIVKEAYCFDVCRFAEKLLDAIIIEAKRKVVLKLEKKGYHTYDEIYTSFTSAAMDLWFIDNSKANYALIDKMYMDWPKISEFNIKLGLEKLEAYVHKWERSSDWVFCVEFLGFESEDCSNIFVYEVEWSKPTKMYPIPQVTASVFFGLEVFKMIPPSHDRYVDVTYIFECSNVINRPGRLDFQEKWLEDIIRAKTKFFKSVTFSVSVNFPHECIEEKYKAERENLHFILNERQLVDLNSPSKPKRLKVIHKTKYNPKILIRLKLLSIYNSYSYNTRVYFL